MDALDKDKVPMLSDDYPFSSDGCFDSQPKRLAAHTRSASTSIPMNFEASNSDYLVSHTGPLRSARRNEFLPMSGSLHVNPKPGNLYPSTQGNLGCNSAEGKLDPSFLNLEKDELHNDNYVCKTEHLLRSGPLGMCNDPYCTTCPTYNLEAERKYYKASNIFDPMFPNALYGDAVGWAKRLFYPVWSYVPGVMNPHARIVQRWNKLFVICCLAAIFVDPLFFLLLSVRLVRILDMMDQPILDLICERLQLKTYIKGCHISYRGGLVDKMVFIVRGTMESKGEDGIMVPLGSGDVCGEELLTWCLENSSMDKDGRKMKTLGKPLISNRVLRCLTHVEAFILRAADLEEVTNLFARVLRNPRVQGAIRYQSPYWRSLAANRIQVAWRYYKKRLNQRRL